MNAGAICPGVFVYTKGMANVIGASKLYGNGVQVRYDDGSTEFATRLGWTYTAPSGLMLNALGSSLFGRFKTGESGTLLPVFGGEFIVETPFGVTSVNPPNPDKIYNPFGDLGRGEALDGWPSHQSYSAGGYDWSFMPYDWPMPAPAAGTLHTSGGSGEYAAGSQGSAGLRSILYLDAAFPRIYPASPLVMSNGTTEAEGPMVAYVMQHQSRFAEEKHYNIEEPCGFVGDSGNGVKHAHIHGLTAEGRRVDFPKFVPGAFG